MGVQQLEARSVSFARNRAGRAVAPQLADIALTAASGRITVLAGATGAGKTTLLYLLGGLLRPTAGEILADGEPISRWTASHRDRWRRHVGLLFQHAELIGDLSAAENVVLPLVPRLGSLATKRAAAMRALAVLDVAELAGQATRELSGGERQRVALARAVVGGPDVLLLDEPTAHQDDAQVQRIFGVMRQARERGAVVVVASHDPRVLRAGLADDAHQLVAGRLLPLNRDTVTESDDEDPR